MSGIRELHTRWDGVAGAPYWTTIRQTTVGTKTADDFRDAWFDFLDGFHGSWANQVTANILPEVTVIESTTGELIDTETVDLGVIAGTDTNPMLPRATQGLVRWGTDTVLAGRRLRGRTFLPAFTENSNSDDGAPDSSVVSGMNGGISAFIGGMNGELVIYSRTHLSGGAITQGRFWTEWASLRSRRD
jgi:hypothetical protein